jgi:hypothetical protein
MKGFAFILVCLVIACPAKADFTGADLQSACTDNQDLCDFWLTGFVSGMFGSQAVAQQGKLTPVSCFPEGGITLHQARLIVEKYMRDHPEHLHSSAQDVVFAALELEFPCNRFVPMLPQARAAAITGETNHPSTPILIPLQKKGGTYIVPVLINKAITLNFIINSDLPDVSIPADVVTTLVRTGTIEDTDFIGTQPYMLADGSSIPSPKFRIRSLTMNKLVIENVIASVAPAGELILGQSFLARFKSWSIDNGKQALVLSQ